MRRSTDEAGESDPRNPVEGRAHRDQEPSDGKTPGTSSPVNVSTRLRRIAELARQAPQMAFTTLAQHIDVELLRAAVEAVRDDGATGVDGKTAANYARDLGANLSRLVDRLKAGTYRAPPVRRVHIPKGDGRKTRPIGIPTYEDKVLQRAVTMVLEAIYEQDFLPCSFGFRPRRSAHQALDALWSGLTAMRGGWVLEADIQSFFDTLDHGHLRSFLDQRVRDGVLRRVVDKWLIAGVMEGGEISHPEGGTPQGGVISPLLANVSLHVVLDPWFERDVKPRMRGRVFLVRYADDFVIAFEREDDARRVFDVLPKRFGKYGLTLHPTKTRLVRFGQPPYGWRRGRTDQTRYARYVEAETFDFLGFTHFWGRTLQGDGHALFRKTARSRFRRAVRSLNLWFRQHRHDPIAEQHEVLCQKLRGHDAYYGITGNYRRLAALRCFAAFLWRKWLNRRSNRAGMTWKKFTFVLERYPIPVACAVHSIFRRGATS